MNTPTNRDMDCTPGEWLTYPHGRLTAIYTKDDQGRDVFIAKECGDRDARLMASSKKMYAALQEAERFLDYFANERTSFAGGGTPLSALAKVRAALVQS